MPTTGLPGNIWYPDDTSPVAPLENLFLTQATSVNVAFDSVNTELESVNTELDRREIQTFRRTTLALLSAITGLIAGDRGFVSGATGNGEYVYDGSAWRVNGSFRMAAGELAGVSLLAGGSNITAVTFPVGTFTLPPIVVPNRTAPIGDVTVGASNVTATGFDFVRASVGAARSNVTASWIAVQMTPGSATG